jgi:hypothetical protein
MSCNVRCYITQRKPNVQGILDILSLHLKTCVVWLLTIHCHVVLMLRMCGTLFHTLWNLMANCLVSFNARDTLSIHPQLFSLKYCVVVLYCLDWIYSSFIKLILTSAFVFVRNNWFNQVFLQPKINIYIKNTDIWILWIIAVLLWLQTVVINNVILITKKNYLPPSPF